MCGVYVEIPNDGYYEVYDIHYSERLEEFVVSYLKDDYDCNEYHDPVTIRYDCKIKDVKPIQITKKLLTYLKTIINDDSKINEVIKIFKCEYLHELQIAYKLFYKEKLKINLDNYG